jgi:hypothetical protein
LYRIGADIAVPQHTLLLKTTIPGMIGITSNIRFLFPAEAELTVDFGQD